MNDIMHFAVFQRNVVVLFSIKPAKPIPTVVIEVRSACYTHTLCCTCYCSKYTIGSTFILAVLIYIVCLVKLVDEVVHLSSVAL